VTEQEAKRPKVFISYSWSSPEHEARVLALANRLIADGVEVVMDKYDLQEGQDLHAFVERMVTDPTVTHVLVVTDSGYAEKANSREKGVGKEAQIISSEVYAKADQTKFLPLVFEFTDDAPCVPVFMKGRIYIDMSTPEREADNYESLVRRLCGKPLYQKPPIGKPPRFLFEGSAMVLPTTGKAQLARKAILDGKDYADAVVEEYFQVFASSLELCRIATTGDEPLDERFMSSITAFLPYRDEFVQFVELLAAYRHSDHTYDTVAEFFEATTKYFGPPEGVNQWDERWYDNFKFIVGELFIYTIAVLIRKKRFSAAHSLLSREYRNQKQHADERWEPFTIFFPGVATLEQDRRQRLKLRWVNVGADTLKNRATGHPITYEELAQTDLVLFLSSALIPSQYRIWMPYTLLYTSRWKPLELFARAESKKQFAALRDLFGVATKDELVTRVTATTKQWNMGGSIFIPESTTSIDYAQLANLAKLDSRP
jgi:hypothetical protein